MGGGLTELVRKHRDETESRCKATKKVIADLKAQHSTGSASFQILDVLIALTQKCAVVAGNIYTEYAISDGDASKQMEMEMESMKSIALRIFDGYEAIARSHVVAEVVTLYGSVKAYIERLKRDWTSKGALTAILFNAGVALLGFMINPFLGLGIIIGQVASALYCALTQPLTNAKKDEMKFHLLELKHAGDVLEADFKTSRNYLHHVDHQVDSIMKTLLVEFPEKVQGKDFHDDLTAIACGICFTGGGQLVRPDTCAVRHVYHPECVADWEKRATKSNRCVNCVQVEYQELIPIE
jgi:hypothetical protein